MMSDKPENRRAAPVAEGVALPPLDAEGLPPLPRPDCTYADHSYPAYSKKAVETIRSDAIAPYAERIRQLERELADWKKSSQLLAASRDRWKDAAGAAS